MQDIIVQAVLCATLASVVAADNNLVTTLIDLEKAAAQTYVYDNPRPGWVFTAVGAAEPMRWLDKGEYGVEGRDGESLVVRAIPEIIHTGLGYQPSPFLDRDFPVGLWPTNTADQRLTVYLLAPPQQRLLFIF